MKALHVPMFVRLGLLSPMTGWVTTACSLMTALQDFRALCGSSVGYGILPHHDRNQPQSLKQYVVFHSFLLAQLGLA